MRELPIPPWGTASGATSASISNDGAIPNSVLASDR
jgi:hypothetical protein